MTQIDPIDCRILRALQTDCDRPVAAIGEAAGLSANATWRRIKALEAAGLIRGRVALIDPAAVGLDLTVFIHIKTASHDQGWLDQFAGGVRRIEEVVEFHRLAGEYDYLLKVRARSIADYDRIYKRLIATAPLFDVSSYFSMECIKETTALPIAGG